MPEHNLVWLTLALISATDQLQITIQHQPLLQGAEVGIDKLIFTLVFN